MKAVSHTLVPIFIFTIKSTSISNPCLGPSRLSLLPDNRHCVTERDRTLSHHLLLCYTTEPLFTCIPTAAGSSNAGMEFDTAAEPHNWYPCTFQLIVSALTWRHLWVYGWTACAFYLYWENLLWHHTHKARADVWRRNVLALVQLLMSRWQIQSHVLYTLQLYHDKSSLHCFPILI